MIFIIYEEKWVSQSLINLWCKYNEGKFTNNISKAKKIWLFNHYLYKKVPQTKLPVITTIHHIEERKFNPEEFSMIDKLTTYYHSISPKTTEILKKYTKKKIVELLLPVDPSFGIMIDKSKIKEKWGFSRDEFLLGSFQRDTEKDGSPKLEKGPDILVQLISHYYPKATIILTGYHRQYIIQELQKKGIKYFYKEKATDQEIQELYNILNLYLVTARVEGGPRAIFECALAKVPILSTDVGAAKLILSEKSIIRDLDKFEDASPDVNSAYARVLEYLAPIYMIRFNRLFC